LAEVLTPHIGGIAGFYRLEGDSLNLVAQRPGVTSHTIGSRNLDMGLAGDLDGDGQPELVVFDQSLVELMALRRTEDGIDGAWQTACWRQGRDQLGIGRSRRRYHPGSWPG